jgi:hypothetical protein
MNQIYGSLKEAKVTFEKFILDCFMDLLVNDETTKE